MELRCGNRRITLGVRLGRGGEGEVFEVVGQPDLAAKLYHQPDATHAAKVRQMTAADLGSRCPAVAFPLDILYTADGRFAGFVMSKIAGKQPIHELLGIGSMKRYFPNIDWSFLVRVSLNLARAITTVHSQHIVIGDINGGGILVGQDATVTLIDADSFQTGKFVCRVGMAEYTPPELQGASLGSATRTSDHDAFGLAVLIFQLLALGRHPFAGVRQSGAMPPAEAIAQNRFAYSLLRPTGLKPPADALLLSDLPLHMRTLFERAFAPLARPRPTASEWVAALVLLEKGLARCPTRPDHIIPSPTTRCPWCRLEQRRPSRIFPAAPRSAAVTAIALPSVVTRAQECGRSAKNAAGESTVPLVIRTKAFPTQAARAALRTEGMLRPQGFSVAQLATFARGPHKQISSQFLKAQANVRRAIEDWRKRVGIWKTHRLAAELDSSVLHYTTVAQRRVTAQALEVDEILRLHAFGELAAIPLSRATVTGVRKGMVTRLAAAGVTTAADLFRVDIASVPGIGAGRAFALLLWRDTMLGQTETKLRADSVVMSAAIREGQQRYSRRLAALEQSIDEQRRALEMHVENVEAAIRSGDDAIDEAYANFDQAVCDMRHLGFNESRHPLVTLRP